MEEKIKKLNPERRKKVEARAKELIAEEMTLRGTAEGSQPDSGASGQGSKDRSGTGIATGTTDVGILLHDPAPGARRREPALDDRRALVPYVHIIPKTVKDVPGRNVKDVSGLDTTARVRA